MSRKFNQLDRFISYWRLKKIQKYIKHGVRVCDLGCGDGDLLRKLNKNLNLNNSIGVDAFSEPKNIDNIKFVKGDIIDLPIDDEGVDIVLMLAVIEHVDTDKARLILSEAQRVLKPKARLLLTTPTPLAKPVLEFMAYKLRIISKEEIEEHQHYYNKKELTKILTDMGFKKVEAKHFQLFMNAFYVFEK